jgi:DNA-binding CsgD family transcriptional regulator
MKTITLKEMKILDLISKGYSTAQIALTYGISSHTVESHRKNLLSKFDAKNSAELVVKAIQANVLNIICAENSENQKLEQHEIDQKTSFQ